MVSKEIEGKLSLLRLAWVNLKQKHHNVKLIMVYMSM